MTITVTATHIRIAEPGNPYFCPVNLALRDAGLKRVKVTRCTIRYSHNRARMLPGIRKELPKKAQDFLFKYDTNQEVKPFQFELEV